jgi:hypothetical protein
MSKKPVEGDLPSPHSTELEDILDQKEFLIKFRHYLASIYSLENFDFWLEAGAARNAGFLKLPNWEDPLWFCSELFSLLVAPKMI